MTTEQVGKRLFELCRQGQWEQAQAELYADNCVSIEPAGGQWPERVEGMEAIKQKGEQFNQMVEEIHGLEISNEIYGSNYIACEMTIDGTFKGAPRMKNTELCVYEVEDGKITKEQFFYPLPPQQ